MPKPIKRGRALCRQLVREHISPPDFVRIVKERMDPRDDELGKALLHLTAAGSDLAQLKGLRAYVYVMAATGNHNRAMRAASRAAEICAPGEDLGPIDRLADMSTAGRDRRHHNDKTVQPTPLGHRP